MTGTVKIVVFFFTFRKLLIDNLVRKRNKIHSTSATGRACVCNFYCSKIVLKTITLCCRMNGRGRKHDRVAMSILIAVSVK